MRKTAALMLSVFMALLLVSPAAYAAERTIAVEVDGVTVAFESAAPYAEDGVTWVQPEPLFQALNIELEQAEQGLTAATEDIQLTLPYEASEALVNGEAQSIPSELKTIDGETYVPLRFVAETFGYEVDWVQETYTVVITSPEVEQAQGFLWKVQNNGNIVYLLGSIHVADESFYPLRPEVESAFTEADYLGVEIDISKAEDPEVQELMLSQGMYLDGTTLKDHISEETYAAVNEFLVDIGLGEGALDMFKPWMIESTITSLQALKQGYDAEYGVDLYFINKAMERGVEIIELESVEMQIGMLSGFPQEVQEQNLLAALQSADDLGIGMDELIRMWKSGDEETLLEMIDAIEQMGEVYYDAMILDRNVDMTDKIEGYLNEDDEEVYFIVVGAAHMPGKDGIITLLEQRGYAVEKQ